MRVPDRRARARLRRSLLEWYGREQRDLPWRRTRDPYAIWVSEAMLQQTRVETVLDYWPRFLAAFPTVEALARAPEEEVLARWSGLGYYRRARALRAAAQVIADEHGGRFPATLEAALALPGVGRYTAGAVLSIAYDAPVPLVDGNVERVFARRFLLEHAAASSELKRDAWTLAAALVPARGAGDWNQALMELGATVCTPRAPRCLLCPIASACRARRAGRAEALPAPRARRAAVDVELEQLWIEARGALLLERRPETGRMAGMWQLPTRETTGTGLFPSAWPAGVEVALGAGVASLAHGITHHRIRARVVAATASGAVPDTWVSHSPERVSALPLTGMTKKALRALQPTRETVEGS